MAKCDNSDYSRFFPEPDISRMGPQGVRWMGLADLPEPVRFTGKCVEWPPPQRHTAHSVTPLCMPRLLYSGTGSWLLSRAQALRGRAIGSPEGRGIAFPRLMPLGRECSTQEKWCVWCERVSQDGYPVGCLFSALPRATTPSLFSHNSGLLCTPSSKARVSSYEGEFLRWPFKGVPVSLTGRIPTDFSQPDVRWPPLLISGALDWEAHSLEMSPCS